MQEGIVKTPTDGRETIVVIPRKSVPERRLAIPVAKWERAGERKAPMKTRTSYCEIESA